MSELADFLIEALFWFWAAFVFVGACGGWFFLWVLLVREEQRTRQAQLDALEAASRPIEGRRAA